MKKHFFDADYFILKFEAIPENLWLTRKYESNTNPERRCALGHCGIGYSDKGKIINEAMALKDIFGGMNYTVPEINDGRDKRYKQATPKQRVIAALYDIKKTGHLTTLNNEQK